MSNTDANTIYLKDYRAPAYYIRRTELYFDLQATATRVRSRLQFELNETSNTEERKTLFLHGQELKLIGIELDGATVNPGSYQLDEQGLYLDVASLIDGDASQFELEIETEIYPDQNTSLEGLYRSSGMFCTQCEAEGFRKITYYLDRPDVMSEFFTHIEADPEAYPVMLSNGNKIADKTLDSGRRLVTWHDPFKKPAYLFALVAADLSCMKDSFTTMSGREVALEIYVEPKDLDKCHHAMDSLKRSMRWDEEVYGREYDLDIFMIVAVDDFNMGAMENKGLNIFNTSCVLAKAETTTDAGFQRVEGVVAHEYFHNWSGNRVTCRDWFQLSLKEGFTVFRDAQFSADMGSATVKRVEDVSLLRSAQFPEDGGPLAHAVQPASFMEISNFYTLTIYEKGAELVRMLHTLLGAEIFRKGSDLYFERHDGEAATIDDFIAAMESVSGRDLHQFMHWYHQAATPELTVSEHYDDEASEYRLRLKQTCRPTAECEDKQAYLIPISLSLFAQAGALPLKRKGVAADPETEDNTQMVIELTEFEEELCFEGINERPVASVLRGFSAPVKLHFERRQEDLLRLMTMESDGFARWDASQQLFINCIKRLQEPGAEPSSVCAAVTQACAQLLADKSLDPAMVALMLSLPSLNYLIELGSNVDVQALDEARSVLRLEMANSLFDGLLACYQAYDPKQAYSPAADQVAERSLKNVSLSYLMLAVDKGDHQDQRAKVLALCEAQFNHSNNMSDQQSALVALANSEFSVDSAERALASFYEQWQDEALVVNLWFSVQASRSIPNALYLVEALMAHSAFDINNPNKVRSLISVFCGQNTRAFHAGDKGEAYQFLADRVLELDSKNPQIAARLITPLTRWAKFSSKRQALMKQALQRIADTDSLSKDVFELVHKSLAS